MNENKVELSKATIINKDDAQLYDEVIACYKNELYRSGYLLAWILLIESLKRKIIKLADLEDARGKQQWAKIEKLEEQHLSTDVQIISSAKECEIISDAEYTTVNLLWQQRCIFAHPYMQKVNSSDLEYIMYKAIDITLSKPLYYGKKNIEENLEEIKNHPHIIPTNFVEQERFIDNQFVRIKEMHYPLLYKNLFYHLSKATENNDKLLSIFFCHYITKLILHPKVNINDPKYTIEKHLSNYPRICWLIFNLPDTWNKLDNKFQGDLFRYIDITPKKDCVNSLVQAFRLICKIQISEDFTAIYYKKLQEFPIPQAYQLYIDKNILLDRIWDEYIKEWHFRDQMKYVDFLESFNTPISDYFNETESERLGYFLGLCCRNNTFTAQTFTDKGSSLWINNLPFCRGLMRGMMTMKDNLFIHRSSFSCVLSVISKLKNDKQSPVIEYLEELPNQEPSNNEYDYDMIKAIFEDKKHLITSQEVKQRVSDIIKAFFAPIAENE